jgi:adenosylhomocysteine nucleosidase
MGKNSGVQNTGSGSINMTNSPVGRGARAYVGVEPRERPAGSDADDGRRADIGIITVLSEETGAMARALAEAGSVRERNHDGGFLCREADVGTGAGRKRLRAVLLQTDDRGQRSTVIAFERLRQNYAPAYIALVGIAGGIHPVLRLGDVAIAQEVIYYDQRKETPEGTIWRGQSRSVPGSVRRCVNDFFSRNGEPYYASIEHPDGKTRECNVLPGPIGSGDAVVADKNSDIRKYVRSVNDKVLALETEAGGLTQAFQEMADGRTVSGWLVVRGISDLADRGKSDRYHRIASWHAAVVLLRMLPHLFPEA